MSDAQDLLALLQLADSALPIGRFVHSQGLEAWLREHDDAGEAEIVALVEVAVSESVAPLDGAFLAHAHRARTPAALLDLDERLTARKVTPAARAASRSCGRQLASLGGELVDDRVFGAFAAQVRARETDGNLAIVQGALARAFGLSARDILLVELRGAAAGLLSVGVRLGRLSPTRAQVALLGLRPAIARACDEALALDIADASSTAPELEIGGLVHRRADARFFST